MKSALTYFFSYNAQEFNKKIIGLRGGCVIIICNIIYNSIRFISKRHNLMVFFFLADCIIYVLIPIRYYLLRMKWCCFSKYGLSRLAHIETHN